jgi:hypothetical protein
MVNIIEVAVSVKFSFGDIPHYSQRLDIGLVYVCYLKFRPDRTQFVM